MTANTYDLVIVGGGITGACIARDASLRGLSVALVEKGDFASATTGASSKLIHGGLRYLQNLELSLVRESLRERRIWSNVAPHMVDPIEFLMPLTSKGIKDRLVKAIGLTLYDWLAYDRNRLDDPDKAIPAHRKLSREETLALEPGLKSDDLTGAMVFYDYQMYSPERLALECILSAAAVGADVANYAQVVGLVVDDNRVTGVKVRDLAPGTPLEDGASPDEYAVMGRVVVNATGPWADVLMDAVCRPNKAGGDGEGSRRLIRSKGIHLITRSLTSGHAIAVLGESTHFFILPWRGYSILGTTDTVYEGDPDKVHVTEKDIVDFLGVINRGFSGARLRRSDVVFFYAGLRPIIDTTVSPDDSGTREEDTEGAEEPDSYSASRAAEVYDHAEEDGIQGIITAVGGKWTTSRYLAEQVVDLAVSKLGMTAIPCSTDRTPTYGGAIGPFAQYKKQEAAEHVELPRAVVEHLAKNYGGRIGDVLALTREDVRLAEKLSEDLPDIGAQVVYAVRSEMAFTLEDVLFRRTGLGTAGSPGDEVIHRVADIMARELGWDETERTAQINRVMAKFASWARTLAVVNPHSWGDRTGAIWPSVKAKLSHAVGPVESVFTDAPMAAQRLTRQALKDSMEQIVAVGGDGTINEVVNGFFEDGEPIKPDAVLAVLTSGTGADFRRTFDMPDDLDAQIERIATTEIRAIDLGKLTFINDNGEEEVRFFDNIASFGLSGATDRAVNRLTFGKKFGGQTAFYWGMLKALLGYKNQPVRIQVDDTFDEVVNVTTAAVCNGRFFGGGMHMAPNAKPNDGLLDVIIVADVGRLELLWKSPLIYKGRHLDDPKVTVLSGRKITATPADGAGEVLLDVDGEAPGRLPATFEIVPNAIYLRC